KNAPPFYDETIHTPLFVWDPRSGASGVRRGSLVQTIDFGPTLLELFDLKRTPAMQGRSLRATVAADTPVRGAGLFGIHGGHVNVTDGRYVYMRAGAQPGNQPLYEYTLMPTAMRSRFPVDVLRRAELVEPFSFTRDVPVLRLPGFAYTDPYAFGTMLFDLHTDPDQRTGLVDDALELRMATLLRDLMRASDAPPEQYVRLGLPEAGPLRHEHLLVRVQAEQQVTARQVPVTDADFPQSRLSVRTPLADLLADPEA